MRIIVLSDKKYSYEDFYSKISAPIKNSPLKYKIFLFVYRYLVYFTVLIYMALLIYCLIQGLYHQFFNAVLTPAITFIVVVSSISQFISHNRCIYFFLICVSINVIVLCGKNSIADKYCAQNNGYNHYKYMNYRVIFRFSVHKNLFNIPL